MEAIEIQLSKIQKLGSFFRQHYTDWTINLLSNGWQEIAGSYIRRISHEASGHTLAYAEVRVPSETFIHFQAELKELGARSIGDDFLFLRNDAVRDGFEVFKEEGQWIRRTQFLVAGYPFLIKECLTDKGLECLQSPLI
jgi:hypothetical protein